MSSQKQMETKKKIKLRVMVISDCCNKKMEKKCFKNRNYPVEGIWVCKKMCMSCYDEVEVKCDCCNKIHKKKDVDYFGGSYYCKNV